MYSELSVMEGKPGLKSMFCSRRKKETFSQNRMKKQELKKMRRGLGTSSTSLNIPTSELEGWQKDKRKSKKLKTFLKK